MPSNPKTKAKSPLVLMTENAEVERIVITTSPDNTKAKGKEEAGQPLYLKRV